MPRTGTYRAPFPLVFALMALAPGPVRAASYQVVDVESLNEFTFDELVTCPLAFGTYISGGEGCLVGRAPAVGECGLNYSCPLATPTIPDALATADHFWSQLLVAPILLDLGQPSDFVFVMNAADHGPFPEESIEWTVWGRNSPDITNFPAGWELSSLCAIFKPGWVESGACPGDDADDYVGLYQFGTPYRYVAVYSNYSITIFLDRTQSSWSSGGDDDPAAAGWQSADAELDAVARPDGPPLQIEAGNNRSICTGDTILFSATATGRILRWRWDADGDGLPDGFGPFFSRTFSAPGLYTIFLTAFGACGCATDSVEVRVRDCVLSVSFSEVSAQRRGPGASTIALEFLTASEADTLGFVIERSEAVAGPWRAMTELEALGSGTRYRWLDLDAPSGPCWYRIAERTSSGEGDVSQPVAVAPAAGAPGGRSRQVHGRR